jgi:hypothetical protein
MEVRKGFQQWFLLRSDAHHDSVYCDRELEKEHLELCKQRNGYVLDFGDVFDAMQGRYDSRNDTHDLRPEYNKAMVKGEKYLNVITNDLADFYRPYASMIMMMSRGNHETAIERHNQYDLIQGLTDKLNDKGAGNILTGEYGGWVRFNFTISGTQRESRNLKYFHGSGGGGPVTRGVIQSNRQAVYLPDADIICNGHIHESWCLAIPRERINNKGVIYKDLQWHVRTATYKDEYNKGASGWHVETGKPPKPLGCLWLRFYLKYSEMDRHAHVDFEVTQDIR